MAKTNYTFEKRQKELAKKQKQEEKRLRKLSPHEDEAQAASEEAPRPQVEGVAA